MSGKNGEEEGARVGGSVMIARCHIRDWVISKRILLPIVRIMKDIVGDIFKGLFIPDDMLIKPGLPLKFKSETMCVFCDGRFIGTDDG